MSHNAIETIMGAVVLLVAGSFLYFAYNNSNIKTIDGYNIVAGFNNLTGIDVGSDVRVGGIKVGVVERLALDEKTYQAQAVLRVRDNVKLPKDTLAAIRSSGLLGEKFIALDIGSEDAMLAQNDVIHHTESAISLEEMLGKFIFSAVDSKNAAPSSSNME